MAPLTVKWALVAGKVSKLPYRQGLDACVPCCGLECQLRLAGPLVPGPRYPSDLTDEHWAVLEPRAREIVFAHSPVVFISCVA